MAELELVSEGLVALHTQSSGEGSFLFCSLLDLLRAFGGVPVQCSEEEEPKPQV